MTTDTYKWAVFNRETGNIAWMREFSYGRQARFFTRDEARAALREGKVYADPTRGKVERYTV